MTMTRDSLRAAIDMARKTFAPDSSVVLLAEAAEAHLATLPAVKECEVLIVTYYSLTYRDVVARAMPDQETAARWVEANGPTAKLHRLDCLTWIDPPGGGK